MHTSCEVQYMLSLSVLVTSKIRNLKDYRYRIIHNLMPQPTGIEIENTLKYFSQTLLSIYTCTYLFISVSLGFDGCFEPTYASDSAAAIITMVLQHTDNGAFHSQILECFMSIKRDIIKDILSVIAYGPPSARAPAANLLFYYWPQLNPALTDRRGIHYKYTAWPPVLCQWKDCVNSGNCQAVKMCLNPALAIHSGDKGHSADKDKDKPDKPPPLYICSDCADILRKDNSEYMTDILLPMSHVSTICENKNCRSRDNIAMCTCFSIECASFNGNRPIRYCLKCHEARHNVSSGSKHVYHLSLPDIWDCSLEVQRYLMDAIVSLLKEAQPIESKRMVEMGEEQRHHFGDDDELFEMEEAGERKLLSRYGIWLLVELCCPRGQQDIPIEVLGRLLGMLFQWFDATAYLPDDNIGSALERLKPDYICGWLEDVAKNHFEVIVSCLLPHPVEYARVGGFWDTLATRTVQIKEGLNCFFCLVPYDIITFEILSSLDIVLPMHMLLSMFQSGVQNLYKSQESGTKEENHQPIYTASSPIDDCPPPLSPQKTHVVVEAYEIYEKETELILPCYIMMLDLTMKQMLTWMLKKDWEGTHTCGDEQQETNCNFCQNIALWHHDVFNSLWKLMQAQHSQLASVSVPLLLHCLTLPSGSDVLWKLVEDDFNHDDWCVRFAADSFGSCILSSDWFIRRHKWCLCQCLEFQFDHVINDRIIILQRMHLLSNVLRNQKILSWVFFMSRFDTLSLEAQLDIEHSTDIPYPTDLSSSDRDCEHFLRKLNRARFALARTDSIRSVSMSSKPPYRRAVSVPIHLLTKTTPPKGGHLKEFTDEESNFTALLQKAMDMEGVDRDAVYQLVTMLMKFMVTCDQNEDKGTAKIQVSENVSILAIISCNILFKSSAVFNAFISGVQFVLDRNFELGNTILPITLLLLQYAPSPQRYASDYQPPNYTLWYLEPHTRVAWLTTLLVILYKYQFYTSPVSAIIQTLVRIVINTLDAQHHKCKKIHDDGFLPPSPSIPRSKGKIFCNEIVKK
ncbi:hypothetical protein KUTeg_013083 [Tegillarca granosa]|uniref:Protein unc-79 homolog n=1 Tax=Tegillarca granosa TaxID=220873 RepID=A0ABQ9ESN6_TEGGR|nr:hypothetical protein KUTeg_013083 [Tegillarca granosa]